MDGWKEGVKVRVMDTSSTRKEKGVRGRHTRETDGRKGWLGRL